jgi:ribosomal protein S25
MDTSLFKKEQNYSPFYKRGKAPKGSETALNIDDELTSCCIKDLHSKKIITRSQILTKKPLEISDKK